MISLDFLFKVMIFVNFVVKSECEVMISLDFLFKVKKFANLNLIFQLK